MYDAWRFVLRHNADIRRDPKCLYSSALYSSPVGSIIRATYATDGSTPAETIEDLERAWGPLIQDRNQDGLHISSFCFSPDSKMLAAGCSDGAVAFWDVETGEREDTVHYTGTRGGAVVSVLFSTDGQTLASISELGPVVIWTLIVTLGKPSLQVSHEIPSDGLGGPKTLSLSPNLKWLTCRSNERTIEVRSSSLNRGISSFHFVMPEEVASDFVDVIVFSSDNRYIATGTRDGIVLLWNLETKMLQWKSEQRAGAVTALTISPRCQRVVSGTFHRGGFSELDVWAVKTGEPMLSRSGHTGRMLDIVFSPTGQIFASASLDGMISLWNTSTGTLKDTLWCSPDPHTITRHLSFSPDCRMLAFKGDGNTVRVWDVSKNRPLPSLHELAGPVSGMKYSPRGDYLVTLADGKTQFWDACWKE